MALDTAGIAALESFITLHPHLFVLTGAGCSTESGIPDYRDENGDWKHARPIDFRDFMGDPLMRARYWARSMVGWRRFGASQPNAAHRALAQLERDGHVTLLVTQNVDRLHEAAGSHHVVDLHGRLDEVRCMQCGVLEPRAALQVKLEALNPGWVALDAVDAPDGDAQLDGLDFSTFRVPPCAHCGGILKPDVVFFGESVPRARIETAYAALARSDAVLVVGSSLMVYSGYRYVKAAVAAGLPVAAINRGKTRADALLTLKIEHSCADVLASWVALRRRDPAAVPVSQSAAG